LILLRRKWVGTKSAYAKNIQSDLCEGQKDPEGAERLESIGSLGDHPELVGANPRVCPGSIGPPHNNVAIYRKMFKEPQWAAAVPKGKGGQVLPACPNSSVGLKGKCGVNGKGF